MKLLTHSPDWIWDSSNILRSSCTPPSADGPFEVRSEINRKCHCNHHQKKAAQFGFVDLPLETYFSTWVAKFGDSWINSDIFIPRKFYLPPLNPQISFSAISQFMTESNFFNVKDEINKIISTILRPGNRSNNLISIHFLTTNSKNLRKFNDTDLN